MSPAVAAPAPAGVGASAGSPAPAGIGRATWPALGTTAELLTTDPAALGPARAAVAAVISRTDRAASRFRPDSELSQANALAGTGTPLPISAAFLDLLDIALDAAELTGGDLDPTVGASLVGLGYDVSFESVPPTAGSPLAVAPAGRWRQVALDRAQGTLRLPRGVRLDLGATAKARCADLAAAVAADAAGCGVLVNLGGDIAVAGPAPEGGWGISISDAHDDPATGNLTGAEPAVAIHDGGLATSSTTRRAWRREDRALHHVVNPATGWPAAVVWRTVTAVAASCVAANMATTTSIIRGAEAPAWLESLGLPARLVAADGRVRLTAGWPSPTTAPPVEPQPTPAAGAPDGPAARGAER